MKFTREQKELIEKIIRANEKFQGREDLIQAFFAEVYKKSYLLLGSVSNIEHLKNYLTKVVDTSITNVINEDNGKKKLAIFKPSKIDEGTSPSRVIENIKLSPKKITESIPREFRATSLRKTNYDNTQNTKTNANVDFYSDIQDPALMVRQEVLNKNLIQRLIGTIYEIHTKMPGKHYYQIFYMRYLENKSQAQIAQKLDIAQNELSKRCWELVKLVKDNY